MEAEFGPKSSHLAQCIDTLAQALHANNELDALKNLRRPGDSGAWSRKSLVMIYPYTLAKIPERARVPREKP